MAQQVELTSLPLPQLNQLSQQLDQELEFLNQSVNKLRQVQRRFHESLDAVKGVAKTELNTETLVPLTSSLYVPGELTDNKTVVVDVGTGYFVEKSVEKAEEYFEKRINEIGKEVDQILPAIRQKAQVKSGI